MKEHYCPEERTTLSYEGECNWCGQKERENERSIQTVSAPILERTPAPEIDEDISIPVAPI